MKVILIILVVTMVVLYVIQGPNKVFDLQTYLANMTTDVVIANNIVDNIADIWQSDQIGGKEGGIFSWFTDGSFAEATAGTAVKIFKTLVELGKGLQQVIDLTNLLAPWRTFKEVPPWTTVWEGKGVI